MGSFTPMETRRTSTVQAEAKGRIRIKAWTTHERIDLTSRGRNSGSMSGSMFFGTAEGRNSNRSHDETMLFSDGDANGQGHGGRRSSDVFRDVLHKTSRAQDESKELLRYLKDAQRFAQALATLLLLLSAYCGLYDGMSVYYSFVAEREMPVQLRATLIARYAAMVAPLLVLRLGLQYYKPRTLFYPVVSALLLAAIPSVAVAAIVLTLRDEVYPCDGELTTSAAPPYCERPPISYLTSLFVLHAYLPYAYSFVPRWVLLAVSTSGSLLCFVALVLAHGVQLQLFPHALKLVAWVLVAHVVGVMHLQARKADIWEKSALRLRQARLVRMIRSEQSHCERLLANILPPHLLSRLGKQILARAHRDHEMPATLQRGNAMPATLGVLVCESYTGCSFLFAKIGGLSTLINDTTRSPSDVMRALQLIFDRFDALADMFSVQKVRKTANEYYLAATGLPNPQLLPTPEDRACAIAAYGFAMIAVMHMVNFELQRFGVSFTVQARVRAAPCGPSALPVDHSESRLLRAWRSRVYDAPSP
jgi:hypothetical protein